MLSDSTIVSRQLHAFADSSTYSFGACVYLRTKRADGTVECALIMGKNKLCPLKRTVTVTRIELSAAVLNIRLKKLVEKELSGQVDDIFLETDVFRICEYLR